MKNLITPTKYFLSIALIICTCASAVQGQNVTLGASMSEMVTGSGFGPSTSTMLSLNTKRHSLAAGINIQNHNCNFTGFRGRYELILNPAERFDIFLFYDLACYRGAYLGKYTAFMEGQINPESGGYFNSVRLNTMEQHAGFGLRMCLSGALKIFWAVGAGHYTTENYHSSYSFQYREKSNCSVIMMTGLKLDIKKIDHRSMKGKRYNLN